MAEELTAHAHLPGLSVAVGPNGQILFAEEAWKGHRVDETRRTSSRPWRRACESIRCSTPARRRSTDRLRQKLHPRTTVHEVAKRTCKKLFENDKTSPVFAIAQTPGIGLESLAAVPQDVVVLADVSISGNIGAIIRTSLALGVGGIVLLNAEPVDIYDRRLIRPVGVTSPPCPW